MIKAQKEIEIRTKTDIMIHQIEVMTGKENKNRAIKTRWNKKEQRKKPSGRPRERRN